MAKAWVKEESWKVVALRTDWVRQELMSNNLGSD